MRISAALEAGFDVKAYLVTKDAQETGDNWLLRCPECEQLKLYVLVKEAGGRKPGTFICFKCDESGGPLDLVRLLEGCDLFTAIGVLKEFSLRRDRPDDLRAAVERALAAVAPAEEAEEGEPQPLPEDFIAIGKAGLIPKYFGERGIDREVARKHGLGYCTFGRYRNRLVVPVYRAGVVRWWLARWMAKSPPAGHKKYLNSPGAAASRHLYDFDRQRAQKRIVIVEDCFSKIWMGDGVVATFGTHFSRQQLSLLASSQAEEVIVMWDEDAIDKAWELARALSEVWQVKVAQLPKGKDPDDMPREAAWDLVDSAIPVEERSAFSNSVRSRLAKSHR